MLRIPADSKPNRMLLAWALVLDVMLALIILFSPSRGSCSGIEGYVLNQGNTAKASSCPTVSARIEYVIIVHDVETSCVVTRITPDEDGFFRLNVSPGRYRLEVKSKQEELQLAGSASAEVMDGKISSVTIQMFRRLTEQAVPDRQEVGFCLGWGRVITAA